MDPTERARLTAHYAGLTDQQLDRALAAGRDGYRDSDVWAIVQEQHQLRCLERPSLDSATRPFADPPVPPASPWLMISRAQGSTWPLERPLPIAYLVFLAAIAGVYTLANAYWFVVGVVEYNGYHLYEGDRRAPLRELLNLAWSAAMLAAPLGRRPWAWYFLLIGPLAGTVVRLGQVFMWDRAIAAVVWLGLTFVYLARRRPRFGLTAWPSFF